MEILIAVSSAIAFLALIIYLWNSDRDSKDGSRESAKDESQAPGLTKQPGETPLILSGTECEGLAELGQKIDGLTRERAGLLNDLEDYRQRDAAMQVELREAQANAARSSQRVVALEAQNSLLHSRLAELDSEHSSHQGEMASLHDELRKLTRFEQEAGILRQEKADLMEHVKKIEIESAAVAGRLLALQDLEAKQPELEQKLANLSEQNGRLLNEITGLQSSLRDKIKTQLDGLQELYKNLTPGLN